MKKTSLFASAAVAALALGASPVFAQAGGPFADVPADHWAYAAVDKLQKAGIVIGYPDGTYGGKRQMTRYEFAVAIARLLDKLPVAGQTGNFVTQDQLNTALAPYAKTSDLANYATKADLAGFATKADLDRLTALMNEFRTELISLGVDLDAVKKRLSALEGRVDAIETELKRVQISGSLNLMGRANNRDKSGGKSGIVDLDGYTVTRGRGTSGNLGADARVLHDFDLKVKARLSETATAETVINYGNYLPFLNSIGSYSGARSDRSAFGAYAGSRVSQDEAFTVYKAVIETPISFLHSSGANVQVGRLPIQFTPYTLKLIDTDSYFNNVKTDLGDIPVDGAKLRLNLGPVSATGFAAKVDPIKFLSNENNVFADQNGRQGYGVFAGAGRGAYANGFGGGFRGFSRATVDVNGVGALTGNRPVGNSLQNNGSMLIEQMAGVRAILGRSALGTVGATYLVATGASNVSTDLNTYSTFVNPSTGLLDQNAGLNAALNSRRNFDHVTVYGADINTNIIGLGVIGSYTKSDTSGTRANTNAFGVVTSVDGKSRNKTTKDNEAYDAAATYTKAKFNLTGGYKYVGAYFAAPGYWDKIGAYTNPVDIKGAYVKGGYSLSNALAFTAEGRFYQGTGKAVADGGLTTGDKIQNLRAGLKYGLTSASGVDAGIERTEYKIGATGVKPIEYFYNIGYGYSFNPATSFKLLYQIVDYRDRNSGFDTQSGKGGIAAAQFSVKF